MDDYEIGPPMARYSDYPASVSSHTPSASQSHNHSTPTRSPNAPSFNASLQGSPMDPNRTPTPGGAASSMPHILGMRAETGSLFREAVWPPPGQPSTLVDPLVNGSSTVDLGRIVDDVMGPGAGGVGAGAAAHPPSAYRGPGGPGASSTTLVPDDPFASLASLNTAAHSQAQLAQYPGPPSAMHSRETSETPLLPKSTTPGFFDRARGRGTPEPPGSPVPMPKMGPLFVTNMGPLSPEDTVSPGSPPPTASAQPRNWLERSPKKMVRASLDRERDAAGVPDIDVTEASSAGHGVGEAM
ncbi:uncharacterized protein TRAVEDRAFT_32428 [Trametes versicolor FP-101664 SS1]|uniref:Uncharacterized protein n=1 Tax=Trametes versicolor (strain FP-101664) TaxID=717944 RepID=R7S7D9_TRAVS|nr:uncharacterized protein TRAVEDRAFT_32428 [Trametes versicolor FP-101664 SS1]EIW51522.1 hypothetical protein TRAVEDRAFT_32428 [Trametes versicolor FP-101664 SS1]